VMGRLKSLANAVRRLLESSDIDSDLAIQRQMRSDWDMRAKENARHHVATLQENWTDEDFFKSGSIWLEDYILPDFNRICADRSRKEMRVLEIGCGAGRMTKALCTVFGQVDAVDISSEMIAHARAALKECPNVRFHLNNGVDLSMFSADQFDFAVSVIVFQHIPRRVIVENYIAETWRVLRPGSLFRFQVQGCPISEQEADTWVGPGFSEEQIHGIAEMTGFEIKTAYGAGTQHYWLSFFKPG
jgi:SAM-dependent methyltransferase